MENNSTNKFEEKKQVVIRLGPPIALGIMIGLLFKVRGHSAQINTLNRTVGNLEASVDSIADVVNGILINKANPGMQLIKVPA
jgi:hypothetical protein